MFLTTVKITGVFEISPIFNFYGAVQYYQCNQVDQKKFYHFLCTVYLERVESKNLMIHGRCLTGHIARQFYESIRTHP